MHARVTEVRVDTEVSTVEEALDRFRAAVLPTLQEQPGYRGVYVLSTAEGAGLLVSLWATEDAAAAIDERDWYFEVMRDLATLFRDPPGRVTYEVLVADPASGAGAHG